MFDYHKWVCDTIKAKVGVQREDVVRDYVEKHYNGGVLTANDFAEFQSLIDEIYHPVITDNELIAQEEEK